MSRLPLAWLFIVAALPSLVSCANITEAQDPIPRADRPRALPGEKKDLHRDMLDKIELARTPDDHLQLAEYFEQQAEEREEHSTIHIAMAARYNAGPAYGSYASDMRRHCLFLASQDSKSAADFRILSRFHRRIAEGK
ncbi:MAG: hypothetical protein L6Q38_16665 [Nitrospira sp.]|nr:hypothetical protein [Nitrospira sp.]CAG0991450.1 hypothetical protein GEOBC_02396 [Geobacteraceae bacterium]